MDTGLSENEAMPMSSRRNCSAIRMADGQIMADVTVAVRVTEHRGAEITEGLRPAHVAAEHTALRLRQPRLDGAPLYYKSISL